MNAPDKIYIAETPNKLIEIWSEEPIESKPYITALNTCAGKN